MIQRTYDPASEAEFAWMVSTLKDRRLYDPQHATFVQLYFSRFSMQEASRIMDYLRREVPHVSFAGMSLYGDPLVQLNTSKFLRLCTCQFDDSDVAVFSYDAAHRSVDDIAADFRARLAAIPDAKGVLVLGSGLTFNISRFMELATRDAADIPFFGSQANINTADTDSVTPYIVGGGEVIATGVVAAVFSGKDLHFYTESLFGWKPIGKPLAVETGAAGAIGDTLITKIDGKPAVEIYKRYLNVLPDRHFISNICEFPLVVERNGCILPRIPCGFDDAGRLNTMGDLHDGETVRFTYGKTDDLIRASWEASARMASFYPQAVFLFVCANRAIFMKERAHEEIDDYKKIAPSALHCHGFSELYRYQGRGGVFNSTLIAVGLREGGQACDLRSHPLSVPHGVISFDTPQKRQFADACANGAIAGTPCAAAPVTPPAQQRPTQSAVNTSDFLDAVLSAEPHSMFEKPLGTSIPLADRLVTFLEATTEDLKHATEAANAASNAKSAFLSSMSHEIRTPINAVLGLDEMILRESNEAAIKGYARDIQSSGKSLLSIINDILDFSKIEAGKMEIINADWRLDELITDVANMVETRAHKKGLEFIVQVDTAMPYQLFGDGVRIKQCVVNILTNAVKYTQEGSVTLSVGYERTDERSIALTVHVVDTGIGIKDEDLPKLFSPFERIEESRNRSIEGTGLGMSIVNGLLGGMGTHLEVQSVYGKGSDFSFTLLQDVRDWAPIGTRDEARARLLAAATSYQEAFQAPDAHILVVDDTPMNLTVFCGLLKPTRIQIDTASSGEEALQLLSARRYDLLFIDHLMPKMDGIALLHALRARADSPNQRTPSVALTANAVSGARERYLAAGFENYLSKPIDSKQLEAMIVQYLPVPLVLLPGAAGFVPRASEHWNGAERRADGGCGEAGALFSELFALDIASALKNCGGRAVFMEAIKDFHAAIDANADAIERYAARRDWKNYTVLVHALKSSARLIGANALSDQAKALEAAGTAAQARDSVGERRDAVGATDSDSFQSLGETTGKRANVAVTENVTPAAMCADESATKPNAAVVASASAESERSGAAMVAGESDSFQSLGETTGKRENVAVAENAATVVACADESATKSNAAVVAGASTGEHSSGAAVASDSVAVVATDSDSFQSPVETTEKRENVAVTENAAASAAPASAAITEILTRTPALLAAYRAYSAKLAPLCGSPLPASAPNASIDAKLPLSQAQLDDALSALREVVSAFDFDSADSIIGELDRYTLPASARDRWKKLAAAVRAADQAAVLALL